MEVIYSFAERIGNSRARATHQSNASGRHGPLPESFIAIAVSVGVKMVVVLCNDGEIYVPDGEICQICGQELEELDEVTGTGIHGYYHWICVNHVDA